MQATEVKAEAEQRVPAAELPLAPGAEPLPAPIADRPQAPPAEEGSCCAVPSGEARARPWWLIGGAVLAVPLVLYAGWDWLAATGLATILVAVAPCLVMCALGLCMGRGKSKSETSVAEIRKTYETQSGEPPSRG